MSVEPYAQVPTSLLLGGYHADAIILYGLLDHHGGRRGYGWPSVALLCEELGQATGRPGPVSDRHVQRRLGDLAEAGYIIVDPNAGPKGVNRYYVLGRPSGVEAAIAHGLHPAIHNCGQGWGEPGDPPTPGSGSPDRPVAPLPPTGQSGVTRNHNQENHGGGPGPGGRPPAPDDKCAACGDSRWVEVNRVAYPCTCTQEEQTA